MWNENLEERNAVFANTPSPHNFIFAQTKESESFMRVKCEGWFEFEKQFTCIASEQYTQQSKRNDVNNFRSTRSRALLSFIHRT